MWSTTSRRLIHVIDAEHGLGPVEIEFEITDDSAESSTDHDDDDDEEHEQGGSDGQETETEAPPPQREAGRRAITCE